MSTLRISDAPLLPDVAGTEKIPTGGRGDYAISVDQIKDHIFQDVGKELVGLDNVDNTSDLDKPVSTAQQAALDLKADKTYVDNGLDLKADKTNVYTRSETTLALSKKADLVNGVVPENQIPSSFNDVLEFTTSTLPIVGESGKIYVTTDTNRTWRWSGNQYIEISNGGISDSTLKLQTPRKIANVDFDGTQNIEIPHNNLADRDVVGAHTASAILDESGTSQQLINDYLKDQEKSLLEFIPFQHHDSIKNYEYTVDCHAYIQAAIDWATLNNKGLYAPAGGYLIDGGDSSVRLVNNWGVDKNLIVRGAGLGLTIFKEAAGKTNRVGRFCKMFYLYYGAAGFVGDFGHIKFSGITFDKNGSSNINDSTLYNYEQAHILSGAGSGTVNIKSIQFDDIELRDKIGGGINFSSSPNVKIGKITCNNIISEYHPKVTGVGDGTFGQRGCLEFGTSIEVLDINNPKVNYAQIEPTIASSATNQRSCNVNGGSIRTLEWTDKGGYSYANIVNCVVRNKFLTRGVHVNATNCTLKVPEIFAGGIIKINGGTILLNYDAVANAVTPCSHGQVTGYAEYSEMWLSNLDVRIDNDDPALLPTGFGISAPTVGLMGSFKRILNNVKFDSRIESSINAYGNGDWKVANCDIQGRGIQVAVGGTGTTRGGYVELVNNNYLGSGVKVHLYRNNALWKLKIIGEYALENFYGFTGSGDLIATIEQLPVLTATTQPASSVFSPPGQIVKNNNFNGSGIKEWVKTGAGNSVYQKYIYNITGTVAYSGENLPTNTRGAEYTITLDGAVLGDAVQVTLDKNLSGCVIEAYVSAANTVKARIYNPTAASVTLPAGTLKAKLL